MPAIATSSSTVSGGEIFATGYPIMTGSGLCARVGDLVAPHFPFTGEHMNAHLVQGSLVVRATGMPVCREGDLASCGCVIENGYQPIQIHT